MAAPYDTQPSGPLSSPFTSGEIVITSANTGTVFTPPAGYTAIINNSLTPVTIAGGGNSGSSGTQQYSIVGGEGGTTFFAGDSIGGTIALGGGSNVVAANSSGGGIQGNWYVDIGSNSTNSPGATNVVHFGSGADTAVIGGAPNYGGSPGTQVTGGGTGTWVFDTNIDAVDPQVFLGTGGESVTGLSGGSLFVTPTGAVSGADYLAGGALGFDTIVAPISSGVNTVVGIANGDALFASAGASSNIFYAGGGNETLQGGASSANQTLYGGTSNLSGTPNDIISGGSGNDIIDAGSGNDSIWASTGADSIWFVASVTGGTVATDILEDFNTANDKFLYQGYGANAFTVSTVSGGAFAGDVRFTLSDGTQVIFNNVKNSALITKLDTD